MNNKVTKILIASVIAGIVLLSVYGLYRYLSRGGTSNTPTTQSSSGPAFPQIPDMVGQVSTQNTQTTNPQQVALANNLGNTAKSSGGGVSVVLGTDLRVVSDKPVSGSYFVEKIDPETKQTKLYLRYTDTESGHLYEIAYNENIPKKLSNTTITRVHESHYNNLGDTLLYRRLDDSDNIENILAKIEIPVAPTSTDTTLNGNIGHLNQTLLQTNIREVALSSNKDKVFYLTEFGGGFIGTIENFGGKATGKKQVFSSPVGEWLVQWPKDSTIFFNTKPSVNVPGYLYSLNVDKKEFTKVLNDLNGLTSNISPDLNKILYSVSENGFVSTYLFDLTKKIASVLPLKTLPEKCTWGGIQKEFLYCAVPYSPNSDDYPDTWYQGVESFNDEIWSINTSTGQTNVLADKDTLNKSGGVDAINLQLSPKEDYLSFINKKDQALWLLKIK